MITARSRRIAVGAALLYVTWLLTPASTLAGPPGPPGSEAAAMRTLNEIEPDTVITNLPYSITNAGSYTIVSDLRGQPGQNGVTMDASNVTLDLNGFSLKGNQGVPGVGIMASAASQNITVRNGTVESWGGDGIQAFAASGSVFERIKAYVNGETGLNLGEDSLVLHCVSRDNDKDGISVGNGSTVRGCSAQQNSGTGIVGGYGSRVVECTSSYNMSNGIIAETYATVQSCTVLKNGWHGIHAGARCRIVDNNCGENDEYHTRGGAGILVAGNSSRIEGNNLVENSYGIAMSDAVVIGNLIVRNSASSNITNYLWLATGNHYGQILTSNAMGDSFTNSNPWANFDF
jgi:hypothetical protein